MPGLTISFATPEDTVLLSRLGAQTFQDAFADRMNPEDVAAYLAKSFALDEVGRKLEDPASTFLIARAEGELAGYARLYRGPAPDCVTFQPALELVRFYTCRPWWGRGVSGALMEVCLDLARQEGYRAIWLSSWQLNGRANRFYHKWGFSIAGEATFTVGTDVQQDFILVRRLEE